MHMWPLSIALVLTLGWSTASEAGACPADGLEVGWSSWAPYQYLDDNGRLTGLDLQLIEAVLDDMDCDFQYTNVPWKRQLLDIKTGKLDLITGASYVEEREEYGRFSVPYRQETVVLYVRRGTTGHYPSQSLRDLADGDFQLATTLGYYYGDAFEELMRDPAFNSHVVELATETNAFRMLERGRVDGVLADPFVTTHLSRHNQWQQKFEPLLTVYDAPVHILFSRAGISAALVTEFNQSLLELREAGEIGAIMERYLD